MDFRIENNTQFNSKEIYFNGKPDEQTRTALKAAGFRWHRAKSCWYGFASDEQIAEMIGSSTALTIPETEIIEEGGGLYDGWRGGNSRKWRSSDELKTFLLSDFKKAGIKASVKRNRAGYLISITVTMTVKADEILNYEQWLEKTSDAAGFHIVAGSWYDYIDEGGIHKNIFGEAFYSLSREEQDKIREKIARQQYQHALKHMTESHTHSLVKYSALNDTASARLDLVKRIVASYNHDQSNSMIDYFDRDIYDHYCVKVVA